MTRQNMICWKIGWSMICIGIILIASIVKGSEQPEQINFVHFYAPPVSPRSINDLVKTINTTHPEYVVESTMFDHESYKIAIKAMMSSGATQPDLFTYWAGERTQAFVDAGMLEPIDDLWEQANLDARFGPAVSRVSTYNGHKYMMPLAQYYIVFFYNAAIFKKHDLTPPTTWAEFLTVCATLKRSGVTPIALGSKEQWPAQFWFDYLLLRTAGPEYRQRLMTGHAAYTDPEVLEAYRLWKDLIDRGYFIQEPNVYTYAEVGRMLFHGDAAMLLMGSWATSFFDDTLGWQQQQDYDFFSFPVINPAVPGVALGDINCVLLPRARKVQAAKTVLPYFSDIAPQKQLTRGIAALSPNQEMPMLFYTDIQQDMLRELKANPYWAFNYDLSTPGPVAKIGLQTFLKFLDQPDRYVEILEETENQVKKYFSEQ